MFGKDRLIAFSNSLYVDRPQDPNKPKRAMSAFFLYSQASRQRTKESNPEASFGEIVSTSMSCFASANSLCLEWVKRTKVGVSMWWECLGVCVRTVAMAVIVWSHCEHCRSTAP